ncbi:helix-turn-helix transcriptional regulator [uncultured Gemmiger sp.]|uniref:helix-turn-helix domain-containing protein n=1 Tax=uncultured Gemmiger sp. TaxID=1623490 RepID=UPI0025F8086D|nr:helix-turn-helix transcriptional regulator [uncultured Gemmiger sp.]
MTIGEHIRDQRLRQGLTQKELGERAGIAEPTIRRYELGKLNPKIETVEKIAKALGISTLDLYDDPFPVRSLNLRRESALTDMFSMFLTKIKIALYYGDSLRPIDEEINSFVSSSMQWYAKTYNISKKFLQEYAPDYLKERFCEYLDLRRITPETKPILNLVNLLNEEGQKIALERVQELAEIPKYQRGDSGPDGLSPTEPDPE